MSSNQPNEDQAPREDQPLLAPGERGNDVADDVPSLSLNRTISADSDSSSERDSSADEEKAYELYIGDTFEEEGDDKTKFKGVEPGVAWTATPTEWKEYADANFKREREWQDVPIWYSLEVAKHDLVGPLLIVAFVAVSMLRDLFFHDMPGCIPAFVAALVAGKSYSSLTLNIKDVRYLVDDTAIIQAMVHKLYYKIGYDVGKAVFDTKKMVRMAKDELKKAVKSAFLKTKNDLKAYVNTRISQATVELKQHTATEITQLKTYMKTEIDKAKTEVKNHVDTKIDPLIAALQALHPGLEAIEL